MKTFFFFNFFFLLLFLQAQVTEDALLKKTNYISFVKYKYLKKYDKKVINKYLAQKINKNICDYFIENVDFIKRDTVSFALRTMDAIEEIEDLKNKGIQKIGTYGKSIYSEIVILYQLKEHRVIYLFLKE